MSDRDIDDIDRRQSAAEDALRAAIIEYADAHDMLDGEESLLSEAVVVAMWMKLESDGLTRVTRQTIPAAAPAPHVVGLLHCGLDGLLIGPGD